MRRNGGAATASEPGSDLNRMRLIVVILCSLSLLASPVFAQYEPPTVPYGSTAGAINWNTQVQEGGFVKTRLGQCKWNLEFKPDGTEWARSLSYQNKDTYFPHGQHRPPQLGDQMIEVITQGQISQPLKVNGRLTYQRGPQSVYFEFVVPSYEATSVTHTYTWDPFRNNWQLATGTEQPNYVHSVHCGPKRIPNQRVTVNQSYVSGQINHTAKAVELSDVVLELTVPEAFLSYQWMLNVPLK